MKEYTTKELTVYYKGKAKYTLNPSFVRQQKPSEKAIKELLLTHEDRCRIFEAMENTDDPEDLKMYAEQFENLEFEQQKLWGFKPNRDHHRWFDVPKCKCPKLDNSDNMGTPYRIIAGRCPIHQIAEKKV
jgi:hypothetical protein